MSTQESRESFLKRLEKYKSNYAETSQNKKANFIIAGRPGCGKTRLIGTAPGPILIDSFDPGGTKTLKEEIEKGRVFVDTSFEYVVNDPSVIGGRQTFTNWQQSFNMRAREGFFNNLGTYAIDSGTRWVESIIDFIAGKEKRKHGELQLQDYKTLQIMVKDFLTVLTNLPCNFIFTMHLDVGQDAVTGKTLTKLMTPGKSSTTIPSLFDEYYVMEVEEKSNGLNRMLITEIDGRVDARTRIGANIFSAKEQPHIANLLKKAGYSYEDKQ